MPLGMVRYKVEKERLNMGGGEKHIMFSLVMLELSQESVHIHVDIGTYKKLCALDTHMLGLCAQTCTQNCSSCPTSKESYDILVCQ